MSRHRRGKLKLLVRALGAVAVVCILSSASMAADFDDWLAGVRTEVRARGLTNSATTDALDQVYYIDRVIELDRRQPEFTQTFWRYLDARVTDDRIAQGQAWLAAYGPLLQEVYHRYGVQPRVLVAIWGLETNYGQIQGDYPVVSALATLAYEGRRSDFFRQQLFSVLTLIYRGDVPPDVRGSWAGAMGQPQFIPTTWEQYAVDYDGDGERDLRNSLPDVFASAATYLSAAGWKPYGTWGHEVLLPANFDYAMTGLENERPLSDWQRLGVRQMDGSRLPDGDQPASVLLPAGARGPAFVVYRNFRAILRWNNSILYALAVGHLSDRIAGAGPLLTPRPAEEVALSRWDVVELQSRLSSMGFEAGEPDGIVGAKTRQAIRQFQKSAALPADGYPDADLLQRLRNPGIQPANQ